MRGGVSYIAQRRAITNNKYMKNYDDSSKPSKYIMCWMLITVLGNESKFTNWWIQMVV